MISYPHIDPVAVSIGPLDIHWYALTYLAGFLLAWGLGVYRARQPDSGWESGEVADLITNGMLGVLVGGRVGYILFYDLQDFIADPLLIFRLWDGGMSFHGGFIGVVLAVILFARSQGKPIVDVLDFVAPLVPLGLGFGRIGNFINGELWGRVSDVPWAMVFPADPAGLPRHPSQLYEFALEGVVLFIILWWYSSKQRPALAVGAMFCLWYGLFRFSIEFFREPDSGIGFVAFDWMTRGQMLSAPMIVVGALILLLAYTGDYFAPSAEKYPEARTRRRSD